MKLCLNALPGDVIRQIVTGMECRVPERGHTNLVFDSTMGNRLSVCCGDDGFDVSDAGPAFGNTAEMAIVFGPVPYAVGSRWVA